MDLRGRRITVSFTFWSGPLLEWTVLGAVLLAVLSVSAIQYRNLQGQAEFATVQSTMGSLRTALVLDFVRNAVQGKPVDVAQAQHNPFKLLQALPANYAGEQAASRMSEVAPGQWVFDAECVCIGYRPVNTRGLDSVGEHGGFWFKVQDAGGPLQLIPLHDYRWQGLAVN